MKIMPSSRISNVYKGYADLLARYLNLQENGITHNLVGVTERIAKRLGVKNV